MLRRMIRQVLFWGMLTSISTPGFVSAEEPRPLQEVSFVTEEATPTQGAEPGVAHVSQCAPGIACRAGNGACQYNMPCPTGACPTVATSGLYPSADCYAGRPYTFGDLACDMRAMKSKCGLDDCDTSCGMGSALHDWWCQEKYKMRCRSAYRNQVLGAHIHNKLNYFVPSGNGGEGVPLMGFYRRVYATSPGYYDQRDKQIYGAQDAGVPIAVPLAPGVRYQYNYGWGIPASRVTQISTISPPRF